MQRFLSVYTESTQLVKLSTLLSEADLVWRDLMNIRHGQTVTYRENLPRLQTNSRWEINHGQRRDMSYMMGLEFLIPESLFHRKITAMLLSDGCQWRSM